MAALRSRGCSGALRGPREGGPQGRRLSRREREERDHLALGGDQPRGGYRYVFEPFNPAKVGEFGHFRSKQYLRPDDGREEFLEPARLALTGGPQGPAGRTGSTATFVARRRLIKDIRANLLLGWMRANFPGMPIVLLLRHPCAVVSSRLALGWKDNLDETMAQEDLVEDYLLPMEAEIRAARDDFERHLFLWCIDNYVPLRQFAPGEIHLAFYENLLANPEEELRRLFAFLGEDFDDRVLRKLGRPFAPEPEELPCPPWTDGAPGGRPPTGEDR